MIPWPPSAHIQYLEVYVAGRRVLSLCVTQPDENLQRNLAVAFVHPNHLCQVLLVHTFAGLLPLWAVTATRCCGISLSLCANKKLVFPWLFSFYPATCVHFLVAFFRSRCRCRCALFRSSVIFLPRWYGVNCVWAGAMHCRRRHARARSLFSLVLKFWRKFIRRRYHVDRKPARSLPPTHGFLFSISTHLPPPPRHHPSTCAEWVAKRWFFSRRKRRKNRTYRCHRRVCIW